MSTLFGEDDGAPQAGKCRHVITECAANPNNNRADKELCEVDGPGGAPG